ncbi:MAG: hypothetical protein AB1782_16630 [Cyanobacteriota bacterium]
MLLSNLYHLKHYVFCLFVFLVFFLGMFSQWHPVHESAIPGFENNQDINQENENTISLGPEEKEGNENTISLDDLINDEKNTINTINDQTETPREEIIWNQGENVKVTYDFTKAYPTILDTSVYWTTSSTYNPVVEYQPVYQLGTQPNLYQNDDLYYILYWNNTDMRYNTSISTGSNSQYINIESGFTIYSKTSGNVTFDVNFDSHITSFHSIFPTVDYSADTVNYRVSYAITQSQISSEGLINGYIRGFAYCTRFTDGGGGDNIKIVTYLLFYIYDYSQDQYIEYDYTEDYDCGMDTYEAYFGFEYAKLSIDEISFERDNVVFYPRSEYRHISQDQFEHKVILTALDVSAVANMDIPLSWNYSYSNPVSDYVYSETSYYYNFTVKTYDITVFFLSGSGFGRDYRREKQILAIEDVTETYLTVPSFETGYSNDWKDTNANLSPALNYTIVKDNTASIKLTSAGGTYFDNSPNKLSSGYYYITFSYYFESAPASFRLYYYTTSWGSYTSITELTTNRWHTYTVYYNINGYTSNMNLQFYFGTGSAVIFLDNFHIYQVSTGVESQIDENGDSFTQFSSTFNYLTSYGLYPASYENTTLYLYDRTSQTQIDYYTALTDGNGAITWNWYGRFDQKEYEVRSIAWNSWFGWRDYTEDSGMLSYFTPGSVSPGTETKNSTYIKNGKYSYQLDAYDNDGNADNYITFDVGTWDMSNIDFIGLWVYSNVSKTASTLDLYIVDGSANTRYFSNCFPEALTLNTWTKIHVNLQTASYTDTGAFSLASVSYIRVDFDFPAYTKVKMYLDALQQIQAQKYYFTPNLVSSKDYAETEVLDAWDFSEDTDGWADTSTAADTTFTNGYLHSYITGSTASAFFEISSSNTNAIDTSYYYIVETRMRNTNASWNWQVYGIKERNTGNYIAVTVSDTNSYLTTEWRTLRFTISDSDWTGIRNGITIVLNPRPYPIPLNTSHGGVMIDYVRLIYSETIIGYNWEFNEPDSFTISGLSVANGVMNGDVDNGKIENGIISIRPDTYSYYRQLNLVGSSTTNFIIFNSNNYDYIHIRAKATEIKYIRCFSDYSTTIWYGSGSYFTIGTSWTDILLSVQDSDLEYLKMYIYESLSGAGDTFEGTEVIQIDFIRLLDSVSFSNLYENENYFLIASDYQIAYKTWFDNVYTGIYLSNSYIPKNLSVGEHTFRYQAISDTINDIVLSSVIYEYDYTITEDGVMKIIIHDQQGQIIDFDSCKTYIDGVRLYDQYYSSSDISETYNLTITDLFDNLLYQNTSEAFEYFKEIQITLYSVKILNIQEYPVYSTITRGTKTYSEWILPFEIVKYRLESDTYSFKVEYATCSSSYTYCTLNTSYVSFSYAVNSDTALFVSGNSITDIFNNVNTLISNLADVNASLANQILNVNITLTNVHSNITNQIVNVDINLDNINSTLSTQLINIDASISNLGANVTYQITWLTANITNLNSTLFTQTVNLLSNITNLNSTIYTQLLSILSDISNVNTTLYAQTVSILSSITNVNSSLFTQTVYLLSNITNVNSTIHTQLLSILSELSNVNSSLFSQTVSILSSITNVNSSLFTQTVYLLSNITNVNSTIHTQLLSILSDISNVNTTLYSQAVNLLSNLTNVNSTLYAQTVSLASDISNVNSTLFLQSVDILSQIYNSNLTLYSQTVDILSNITNSNTTLYQQDISIRSVLNTIVGNMNNPVIVEPTPVTVNVPDDTQLKEDVSSVKASGSVQTGLLLVVIIISGLLLSVTVLKYAKNIDDFFFKKKVNPETKQENSYVEDRFNRLYSKLDKNIQERF